MNILPRTALNGIFCKTTLLQTIESDILDERYPGAPPRQGLSLLGDREVEGYGLGELDSVGGGSRDLILVAAGWGVPEAGVSSAATTGEG